MVKLLGWDVGSEWSALSAATVTLLDFLYNAGFQIGNPNGCSILMALRGRFSVLYRNTRYSHILSLFQCELMRRQILVIDLSVVILVAGVSQLL